MSKPLDDAEFWLPVEFLADEDGSKSKKSDPSSEMSPVSHAFPNEFPYEFDSVDSFGSSLSSPVESVAGSTEAESSDEDEFFAGLTRRLAHSTQKLAVPGRTLDMTEKSAALASSPQSTLSEIGSWSVSSNNGSPSGPSQVPSPPTTPFSSQNDTWDLIYAAAGQVARLKMNSEAPKFNNYNKSTCSYYGRSPVGPRVQNQGCFSAKVLPSVFHSRQYLNNRHTEISQHQQTRQEEMSKAQSCGAWGRQVKTSWHALQQHQQLTQIQNRSRSACGGYENMRCNRPGSLPQSSWPSLQQQPHQAAGSGMRAVFLGGSGGIKRECAGTGVFLPRRYGNPPESRKKSGCPTVLLPEKVVQALNLNVDDIIAQAQSQPHFNSAFTSNYDALLARRNALMTQQKRSYRAEGGLNHEIRLPQEWTY